MEARLVYATVYALFAALGAWLTYAVASFVGASQPIVAVIVFFLLQCAGRGWDKAEARS